uniref:Uncharacterized protein n=1 Tax=Cacopsylla melanoneura TaxID=428564 RepID=A0A8D9AY60_9HEMI
MLTVHLMELCAGTPDCTKRAQQKIGTMREHEIVNIARSSFSSPSLMHVLLLLSLVTCRNYLKKDRDKTLLAMHRRWYLAPLGVKTSLLKNVSLSSFGFSSTQFLKTSLELFRRCL